MRISSYQEMLREYDNDLISYQEEREQLLSQYKYSVILEGEYMELENLEKWIIKNTGLEFLKSIYYDKTNYNYSFAEYFFSIEKHSEETEKVISKIFTTYPNVNPSPSICRTNGSEEFIAYNSNMLDVIIL